MIRPSLLRIAVLALCLVLASSGLLSAKPRVAGAPGTAKALRAGPAEYLATVWSFLASVWTKNGSAGDPFGKPKEGGASDPYGKPSSGQTSQPGAENGCMPDPNGQCLPR